MKKRRRSNSRKEEYTKYGFHNLINHKHYGYRFKDCWISLGSLKHSWNVNIRMDVTAG
jgi:hypothetical protein